MEGFTGSESSSSSSPKRMKFSDPQQDWPGLPRNVLFDIADHLPDVQDFVRFGAVCLSWRAIFLQNKNQASSNSPPFLYLEYLHQRAVYNPCKNRVHELQRIPSDHRVYCGSSLGWAVTMEEHGLHNFHVQLHNPFLNKSTSLPPLDDIFDRNLDLFRRIVEGPGGLDAIVQDPDHPLLPLLERSVTQQLDYLFQQPDPPPQPFCFLRKAALSCDPSSGEFVVVGIVSKFYSLAFFRSGSKSWTPIGEMNTREIASFTDVIYFHKTKQFYAALKTGEVVAVDFVGKEFEPKLTLVASQNRGFKDVVLVEDLSTGDLYQVNNEIVTCMDWRRITPFSKFNIFKLDIAEKKWKRVNNLGDKVLFFGYNGSMLRSASNCPGCEPNCVYFITYMVSLSSREYFEPPYAGIYNLEDGSIRPLSTQTLPSTIWLQPTLV